MNKPLSGDKIAILVANGFNEKDFITMQRLGIKMGAKITVISMTNGLVNSWRDNGFGLNFPVDVTMNEALAADFDMLFLPGGTRSVNMLKTTAHTRRLIGGFMDAEKPVIASGAGLELLAYAEKLAGRQVSAAEEQKEIAEEATAVCAEDLFTIDNNLMTTQAMNDQDDFMTSLKTFMVAEEALDKAA